MLDQIFKAIRNRRALGHVLFKPIANELYGGLSTKKTAANTIYLPAFDRVFLQLKAFYLNGLDGDVLEFGVHQGYTAKIIAECLRRFRIKKARLHLFDSFEGLPETDQEDRRTYECINGYWSKGSMGVANGLEELIESKLRKILGQERVFVVKGYFEKILEGYLAEKQITKVMLVNLDCDLYSSSKYVLKTLFKNRLIQDGTLIICDDWMTSFGNPNLGQRKAVQEVLAEYTQWEFEKYFNYGIGSQVFIAHDLSLCHGEKK